MKAKLREMKVVKHENANKKLTMNEYEALGYPPVSHARYIDPYYGCNGESLRYELRYIITSGSASHSSDVSGSASAVFSTASSSSDAHPPRARRRLAIRSADVRICVPAEEVACCWHESCGKFLRNMFKNSDWELLEVSRLTADLMGLKRRDQHVWYFKVDVGAETFVDDYEAWAKAHGLVPEIHVCTGKENFDLTKKNRFVRFVGDAIIPM